MCLEYVCTISLKTRQKYFSKQQRRYENLLPFRRRWASVCFLQASNFWNKWNWRPQIGESLHISLLRLGGVWVIEKRYQDTHWLFSLSFVPKMSTLSGLILFPEIHHTACHFYVTIASQIVTLRLSYKLTCVESSTIFCRDRPITIHTSVSHSYKLSCVLPSLKFVLITLPWIKIVSLPRLWRCVSLTSCPGRRAGWWWTRPRTGARRARSTSVLIILRWIDLFFILSYF